jgi:hypothetical protein
MCVKGMCSDLRACAIASMPEQSVPSVSVSEGCVAGCCLLLGSGAGGSPAQARRNNPWLGLGASIRLCLGAGVVIRKVGVCGRVVCLL